VAIKARADFLSSLFVVPTVSAQQTYHHIHTRASISSLLPATLFCKTLALGVLLTTAANPSTSLTMDAPTIQPKFLKNGSDLGIVAVGFSGGQVNLH
jgi:hypothetical protein